MALEPFKSTKYQVGRITNAITADADGNLILSDVLNPDGINLTQLINGLLSVNNSTTKTFYHSYIIDDFTVENYTFAGETTFNGYQIQVVHDLNLTNKGTFSLSVIETSTGRTLQPQEIIAVNSTTINVILGSITPVTISVIGF